jgi:predicted nucleic acid-binding protein
VIVLDASAAVEWLLRLPLADAVERRLTQAADTLHAPHLLPIEVAQVVRRLEARDELTARRGAQALEDLDDLDLHLYGHGPLLPLVWKLRTNLSAYDAAYVALAQVLAAPLVTTDARMAAAPVRDATIDLVS